MAGERIRRGSRTVPAAGTNLYYQAVVITAGLSKHAIIRQNDESNERLDLWDLGSSNGTFLNGARLNANRPYGLRDGDEIRFGQMIMRIYFQHAPTEGHPNPPANSSSTNTPQHSGTSPLQPPEF